MHPHLFQYEGGRPKVFGTDKLIIIILSNERKTILNQSNGDSLLRIDPKISLKQHRLENKSH